MDNVSDKIFKINSCDIFNNSKQLTKFIDFVNKDSKISTLKIREVLFKKYNRNTTNYFNYSSIECLDINDSILDFFYYASSLINSFETKEVKTII